MAERRKYDIKRMMKEIEAEGPIANVHTSIMSQEQIRALMKENRRTNMRKARDAKT